MFSVSPVASSSAAASKPQPFDTPERVASVLATMVPARTALDPRTTYTLSTPVAEAVLSLVPARIPALSFNAPLPQHAHAGASTQPLLAGDTRQDLKVDAGVATDLHAADGRADMASPGVSKFSDAESMKARLAEEALKAQAYMYDAAHVSGEITDAIGVYLMCNDVHYEEYKTEHPSKNIHWINVDNKKIVAVWPKITDTWFTRR